MIEAVVFGLAYAVKGGWLKKLSFWEKWSKRYDILQALDGKAFSVFIVFLWALYAVPDLALFLPVAWLIGIAPSMGEEAGGVGRLGRAWGPYIDHFDRTFAVKEAVIRGVFTTAFLAVILGNPFLLLAGASFPAVYWLLQTAYWKIHGKDSWGYAEPVYGALIGLAIAAGL